jgi:signal transduction histidine kinase
MLGLINNILDVSKIKQGKLELRPDEVDVAGFINSCMKANEFIGSRKNIRLNTSVAEGVGVASFDKERMHQAVDNLLSNAFKYSNPGTTVTLGAERSKDSLKIWVSDQGVGIKEDELDVVFDEFFRTSTRPTGGESSHGLGLAITKKVVEMHGGHISVESKPGKGSVFTITLPL